MRPPEERITALKEIASAWINKDISDQYFAYAVAEFTQHYPEWMAQFVILSVASIKTK